ncbi:hypothetical protein [Thalassobacillus sp. C254]|uniref:hypothetical protein n=1 Tax=Thalassobacillus sp. C254 TaxID=1225341 RepID=UPI0006CF8D17|nr:hypothetical protein [Thalassobacillus sp. C254]
MKVTFFIVSFITINSLIIGCSDQRSVEFVGKGNNWDVKYTAHIQGENQEDIDYIIRYIGSNSPPDTINYKIDSLEVTGAALNENAYVEHTNNSCSGCTITNENDELEVTIKWEEESESFYLTSN